jgi:uncharacterized protein with von Willebrand factor type A (vWA) domain
METAHAVRAAPNVEVFTGTRLTRVTRAASRREQALSATAHLVSDWDGGLDRRALQAFLAIPVLASRPALPVIISADWNAAIPCLRDATLNYRDAPGA